MLSKQTVARVSTILDELRDDLTDRQLIYPGTIAQLITRVDEAQRLLLGDPATDPRDN